MSLQSVEDTRLGLGGSLLILVVAVAIAPMLPQSGRIPYVPQAVWRRPAIKKDMLLARKSAKTNPVSPVVTPVLAVQSNDLRLHPILRDYIFTFTGTITCHGTPCAAHIDVEVAPFGADSAWISKKSDADGKYSFQVPFKSYLGQNLDWTMTLQDSNNETLQTGGSQIMINDATQTFSRDFDIQ